jgi:transposase
MVKSNEKDDRIGKKRRRKKMLRQKTPKQTRMEMVMIEELVPQEHLLRKIDKYIDFSFINGLCKPYYSEDNGRPAIEPEILFKMLFIGYLYGIRSERRIIEEVKVNIAYRWFWVMAWKIKSRTRA